MGAKKLYMSMLFYSKQTGRIGNHKKIAVFVGSLRKGSFNRKMARALITLAPDSLTLEIIEIGGLPLYDQDYDDEGKPPSAWTAFRDV